MKREQLWNTVDRLLWEEWDPIGLNNDGAPNDEYKSYVSEIVDLIRSNQDENFVTRHLHKLANEEMGLSSKLADHTKVARKLRSLV